MRFDSDITCLRSFGSYMINSSSDGLLRGPGLKRNLFWAWQFYDLSTRNNGSCLMISETLCWGPAMARSVHIVLVYVGGGRHCSPTWRRTQPNDHLTCMSTDVDTTMYLPEHVSYVLLLGPVNTLITSCSPNTPMTACTSVTSILQYAGGHPSCLYLGGICPEWLRPCDTWKPRYSPNSRIYCRWRSTPQPGCPQWATRPPPPAYSFPPYRLETLKVHIYWPVPRWMMAHGWCASVAAILNKA